MRADIVTTPCLAAPSPLPATLVDAIRARGADLLLVAVAAVAAACLLAPGAALDTAALDQAVTALATVAGL